MRREISSKNKDFQAVLRQKQPDANLAMIKWTNSVHQTSLKPTWKTLLLVLRLINLDHFAEQINTYLSGGAVKQLSAASKEQESKRIRTQAGPASVGLGTLTRIITVVYSVRPSMVWGGGWWGLIGSPSFHSHAYFVYCRVAFSQQLESKLS